MKERERARRKFFGFLYISTCGDIAVYKFTVQNLSTRYTAFSFEGGRKKKFAFEEKQWSRRRRGRTGLRVNRIKEFITKSVPRLVHELRRGGNVWWRENWQKEKLSHTMFCVHNILRLYRLPLSKPKSVRVYKNPIRVVSERGWGWMGRWGKLRTGERRRPTRKYSAIVIFNFPLHTGNDVKLPTKN